jgi:hypothetical protein
MYILEYRNIYILVYSSVYQYSKLTRKGKTKENYQQKSISNTPDMPEGNDTLKPKGKKESLS